jgi:hypothetical protein
MNRRHRPTRTPHPSCDASVYVNNATRSDPLLGYAHDLIGDPMFYGTAIRPLTVGFAGYYRFLGLRRCSTQARDLAFQVRYHGLRDSICLRFMN